MLPGLKENALEVAVNCKKQQKQFTLQGHQVRTYKTTNQFDSKDNPS
jgi:hypothetical protein